MSRTVDWVAAALLVLASSAPCALAEDGPLTAADREAFAWYDGIGLPSCRDKPLVRITWTNQRAAADAPRAERIWELDGFVVAEADGVMTVLDGDLWPRKVTREPAEDWAGGVETRDLRALAVAAAARLRAMLEDPGAVESIDELYKGLRIRFGDEGLALALARQCAENGLDAEARELLEAARAVPHMLPGLPADAPLQVVAARQMHEPVLWRVIFDFHDAGESRAELLRRLQGWLRSFPDSPHQERAAALEERLAPMVREDEAHEPVTDDALAALPPLDRARALVWRLRDQRGDVRIGWRGSVSVAPTGRDCAVDQLVALGGAAVPVLVDALADARLTRAVLFRADGKFGRQYVARVGDMARVALERITKKEFWQPTAEAPSMFQVDEQDAVQERWREWLGESTGFAAKLAEIAGCEDPAERSKLARALPDRGSGPLGGSRDALWGTKSCAGALTGVDANALQELLGTIVAESPFPRTQALAAWALHDLGAPGVVPSAIEIWRGMSAEQRADPVQGGALISFLAACGDVSAISALDEGLDDEPAAVRELVVLCFERHGLGAVRGFAANGPDGVSVEWRPSEDVALAIEDLLARRLDDLEEDPLGRIPRQEPICDMVPSFDCGRRIADAAVRVLNRRWPAVYEAEDAPVRDVDQWETSRTTFQETCAARRKTPR